jgi:hypothetical protein
MPDVDAVNGDAVNIVIDELTVRMALSDAAGTILSPSYASDASAVQTVPLRSTVLDFRSRQAASSHIVCEG